MADAPDKSNDEPSTDVAPAAGNNTNADSLTEATQTGQTRQDAPPAERCAPGQMLGVYRLEKKLGEGGMGAVWKAQHTKLGKTVALKVLPRQLTSNPDSVGRFEREMKAVGLLDHPHIIRAMDAGEIDGTHFLVMEYADGVDLAEVVRQRGPRKVRDACEMIRQAALGLGHAHQHGLIHRDIKPTNLFLTKAGQVKILDLGLARLQGEEIQTSSHDPTITRMGQIMGTPDYMATEQWDDTHSVDGRADLYSLGCTLFFLLAGRAPFADEAHHSLSKKLAGHSFEEIPDLPAARQAAAVRYGKPLDNIPNQLVAVYRRLMAKKPEDRYQTAAELAKALAPIIKGPEPPATVVFDAAAKPAETAPPTVVSAAPLAAQSGDKLAQFFQTVAEVDSSKHQYTISGRRPAVKSTGSRKPWWIAAAGIGIVMILVAAGLALLIAKSGGIKPGVPLADNKTSPDTAPAQDVGPATPVVKLPAAPVMVEQGAPLSPMATVGSPAAIEGLRSWSIEFAGHHGNVSALAWSPAGDVLATTGSWDGSVRLWNTDGTLRKALFGHRGAVQWISFSHDGTLLASGEGFTGRTANPAMIRVWQVASGACAAVISVPSGDASGLAFSPVNDELAFASPTVLGIASLDGKPPRTRRLTGSHYPICAWSPDGKTVLCAQDKEMTFYDPGNLEVTAKLGIPVELQPQEWFTLQAAAWSPDGKWIAASDRPDGSIHIWDAAKRQYLRSFPSGNPQVYSLAWNMSSRWLLVSGYPGMGWRILDAVEGKRLTSSEGAGGSLSAWSPDNKEVVLVALSLVFFDEFRGRLIRTGSQKGICSSGAIALTPDGTEILAMSFSDAGTRTLSVFDAPSGELTRTIGVPTSLPGGAYPTASPQGNLIALRYFGGVVILDRESGHVRQTLKAGEGNLTIGEWSPDGKFYAAASDDKSARIWNVETGQIAQELPAQEEGVSSIAWSPDGSQLATVARADSIQVWDAAAGTLRQTIRDFPIPPRMAYFYNPSGNLKFLVWTPAGDDLWINRADYVAQWNFAAGRFTSIKTFPSEHQIQLGTQSLSLSPDGKTLLIDTDYVWTLQQQEGMEKSRILGEFLGQTPQWLPDSRRFLSSREHQRGIAFDTKTNRRLGTLFPGVGQLGRTDNWLCIGPHGHYRGGAGIEEHIVYVALFEDGRQETFTPAGFQHKFGWQNDPDQAALLELRK